MSKTEKPLIYVAESSRILCKMICAQLESLGYETQSFCDGLSVLKKIVSEIPALVIASKSLPIIDGIELCNILKTDASKSELPFILVSSDEEIFDFWNSTAQPDKAIPISSQNIDLVTEAVKEILCDKYIEVASFWDGEIKKNGKNEISDEEKLVSWVVGSMNKSANYLSMTKSVLELYPHVKETDALVEKMFRMFYSSCEYDVATMVLDGKITKAYEVGTELFDEDVVQDFRNICKTEYEQKANKNHTIIYERKIIPGIVRAGCSCAGDESGLAVNAGKKLESYHTFTIKTGEDFVGTLHLASTKKRLFNYKVLSSIEFVIPALANLIQESVQRSELLLQETKLRSAFLKFVPEQVINDFLNSDENKQLKNRNEKRNVVILMGDIRNFTSISEINEPEDVVNFLNTYFTTMVDVVKKYGGTVDKFVGDGIMVLFGAPISYNDNAKRAVQAAIEMYSQLDKIPTDNLKFPEGMKFDIGIGIHSGDVIVGHIGSVDKTNYTVIGDSVNISSRLEGLTRVYDTKIIISKTVYDELGKLDDNMHISVLDSVKVKGKKKIVQIYRVDNKMIPAEFTQAYEKGFKSYNEGAFSLAIPYFQKALEVMPEDKATKIMLGRCAEFVKNKPENWDGAIAFASK